MQISNETLNKNAGTAFNTFYFSMGKMLYAGEKFKELTGHETSVESDEIMEEVASIESIFGPLDRKIHGEDPYGPITTLDIHEWYEKEIDSIGRQLRDASIEIAILSNFNELDADIKDTIKMVFKADENNPLSDVDRKLIEKAKSLYLSDSKGAIEWMAKQIQNKREEKMAEEKVEVKVEEKVKAEVEVEVENDYLTATERAVAEFEETLAEIESNEDSSKSEKDSKNKSNKSSEKDSKNKSEEKWYEKEETKKWAKIGLFVIGIAAAAFGASKYYEDDEIRIVD